MILGPEQVKAILGKYLDILRECMEAAWKRYHETITEDGRVDLTPRSRASVVYDYIVAITIKRFLELDDSFVSLDRRRGFLLMNFGGKILLRFKKFNKRMRPEGIRTRQNVSFMTQGQGILLECVTATKLVAGYKLDDFQSGIELMAIVCPDGNKCELYLELDKPPMAEVVTLRQEYEEEQKQVAPRVRPKEGVKDEDTGGEII